MGRCLLQAAGLWLELELGSIVSAAWNKLDVWIRKSSRLWRNTDTHSGPVLWSSKLSSLLCGN